MTALAKIHIARKDLGMDEETYRAFLRRETGKDSAKDLSEAQRGQVIAAFEKAGWKGKTARRPDGRTKLDGPFARKLQALWIGAWNLGLVRNRDDAALLAFVKRQTGIDHTRFLRDGEDARKAIDALKGWMAREAGVDWRTGQHLAEWERKPGYRIASAQFAILKANDPAFAGCASLGEWLSAKGYRDWPSIDDKGWRAVMNELGQQLRQRRQGD